MENATLSLRALETVFADFGAKSEIGTAEVAACHACAAQPSRTPHVHATD